MHIKKGSTIFDQLDPEKVQHLKQYMLREVHPQGVILLQQGEQGRHFYVIHQGQVEVCLEGDGSLRVAVLGPGEFFGELSCLTNEPVSATIRTLEQVEVTKLDREGLLELLDMHPPFLRNMLDQLLNRMQKSNLKIKEENTKMSIMMHTLHAEHEPREEELLGQSEAMLALKEEITRLANRRGVIFVLGEQGVGKKQVARKLHYSGAYASQPILFQSGLEFSLEEWERKLRVAERGTIILSHTENLPVSILKEVIHLATAETMLIMTGSKLPEKIEGVEYLNVPPLRERRNDIPILVREFLKKNGVKEPDSIVSSEVIRRLMLYPFLEGNVEELYKVVQEALIRSEGQVIRPEHVRFGGSRIMGTRPKVGLALGGGAVRGSAHVGVLKVLEEEQIPIDYIAGSSVGSLVGALYASGMSVQEMEERLPQLKWRNLIRPCWPREGFVDSSPMSRWLAEHIPYLKIEDLPIPFAAVAADSHSGSPVIMRSGHLPTAIRASTGVPVMMRPVDWEGKKLIDGAVVHKVPVHLARSMGADLVIAVDVGIPFFSAGPAKNFFDILMYSYDIMQERLAQDELELADIVVRPVVSINGYSFKNAPHFFQKGEEETRKAISSIKRKMVEILNGG